MRPCCSSRRQKALYLQCTRKVRWNELEELSEPQHKAHTPQGGISSPHLGTSDPRLLLYLPSPANPVSSLLKPKTDVLTCNCVCHEVPC